MADLTGKKIQDTYKRLIQLSGAGQQELSASAATGRYISDGAGNNSVIALSQSRVGINTTSPADIVHIYDGSGSSGIRIDSQLPYINLIDNNAAVSGAGNFRISTDGTDDSNVGAFIVEDINASLVSQGKPFIIQTGADTNSLYIQADNKVGIGTSTPSDDLEVSSANPTIRLNDTDGYYATIAGSSGSIVLKADVGNAAAGESIQLWTGGSQNMTMDAAGKVGVGTITPETLLHFNESDGADITLTRTEAAGSTQHLGSLHFGADNGDISLARISGYHDSATDAAILTFATEAAGEGSISERMRITSAGNVGIGETDPGAKLHLDGDMIIERGHQINWAAYDGSNLRASIYATNSSPYNELVFSTGTNVEAMRIDGDGKVGIGTNDPAATLHLYNNTTGELLRLESKDTAGDSYIQFVQEGGTEWGRIGYQATANNRLYILNQQNEAIYFGTNNDDDHMVLDSTGKLGINVAAPDEQLHVNSGGTGVVALLESTSINAGLIFETSDGKKGGINLKNDDLYFRAGGDGASEDRMVIKADGDIGIGYLTPGARLDVVGDGSEATSLGSSVSTAAAFFAPYNLSTWGMALGSSSGQLLYIQGAARDGSASRQISLNPYGGYIGIGTTEPSTALDIDTNGTNNGIKVQSSNDSKYFWMRIAGGSRELCQIGGTTDSIDAMQFGTNVTSSPSMVIDSSGKVGIGDVASQHQLSVLGGIGGGVCVFSAESSGQYNDYDDNNGGQYQIGLSLKVNDDEDPSSDGVTTNHPYIDFRRWTGGGTVHRNAAIGCSPENSGDLVFYVSQEATNVRSTAERMRITQDGDIGIGEPVPLAALDVVTGDSEGTPDNTNIGGMWIRNNNSGDTAYGCALHINAGTTGTAQILFGDKDDADIGRIYYENASNNMTFITNNERRMVVDANGMVGIGTSSPNYPIHASASIDSNYIAAFWNSDADNPRGMNIYFSGASNLGDGASDEFIHCNDSDGMHFAVYGDGDAVNTDNSFTSDRRIKTDIEYATSKLDDINSLKVRNFKFKHSDGRVSNKKRIGFIADEFKEVFPTMVKERKMKTYGHEFDDLQTITGSALVPMLVKAIQELTAKVEALENK